MPRMSVTVHHSVVGRCLYFWEIQTIFQSDVAADAASGIAFRDSIGSRCALRMSLAGSAHDSIAADGLQRHPLAAQCHHGAWMSRALDSRGSGELRSAGT